MSQVGNVEKMYGNTLSIITSNAPGNKILDYGQTHVFTENSIIITSPINKTEKDGMVSIEDKGTPSMFCVDFEGKPLRLTYTIQPGDGLISDTQTPDIIRMNIDHHTLDVKSIDASGSIGVGQLKVFAENLIDNNSSLVAVDNNLVVNPNCIIDNHTLKTASRYIGGDAAMFNQDEAPNYQPSNPQIIYVDKENLCDGSSIVLTREYENTYHNPNSVDGEDYFTNTPWKQNSYAKLKVNTAGLDKATKHEFGIVKPDNNSITISEGVIGVNTARLTKLDDRGGAGIITALAKGTKNEWYYADKGKLMLVPQYMPKTKADAWGVCKVDGKTILADTTGIINVNTKNLLKATSSNVGVVQVDGKTIDVTQTGKISVNTQNLTNASTTNYGVVKYDGDTLITNSNNQLMVNGLSTMIANINDLIVSRANMEKDINELRATIANLKSQLTNTNTTLFNLYTDSTRVAKFTSFTKKMTWISSTTSYDGPGNTKTIVVPFYLNYKPGVSLRIETSGLKNWSTFTKGEIYKANNNNSTLSINPGNNFTIKQSNEFDLYQVALVFAVTVPSSVQTSTGTINFYGPDGDLLESIPISFIFEGSTDRFNVFNQNAYVPSSIGSIVTGTTYMQAVNSININDATKAIGGRTVSGLTAQITGIRTDKRTKR